MDTQTLYLWAWAGSAIVATFVGFDALGCNILQSMGLTSMQKEIKYLAGAVGLMALCTFCMKNDSVLTTIHAMDNSLNSTVWLISAITAFSIGLAALGINILSSLCIKAHRKTLQYIAGAAGTYSLYLYFGK